MKPKKKKGGCGFKIGNVYVVDYDDHYHSEKSFRSNEDGKPMTLRNRGVCVKVTEKCVVLESGTHTSDTGDQRSDRNGILRFAITRVQDFGKEK